MKFDVVIVGAGPAGMFAAYELSSKTSLSILVIDQGRDVKDRKCLNHEYSYCKRCNPCNIMCGIGGAGALSSCLLNLHPQIGGNLISLVGEREAWNLIRYIDEVFIKHGAPDRIYSAKKEEAEELERKAAAIGVKFIPITQRHVGTDLAPRVIEKIKATLERNGVKFLIQRKVESFKEKEVKLINGSKIETEYIILAPGRVGAIWLSEQLKRLGVPIYPTPIDIGVRIEVPSLVMEPIVNVSRDPKFYIYTDTYDDFARTFCVNHQGFVVKEVYDSYIGVNGHSFWEIKSQNTNFALLIRVTLTKPLEDTLSYGKSIAMQTTVLGGGKPLIQRLGDLWLGRRSTWSRLDRSNVKPTLRDVTPGDITMAMPHRIVTDILEALEKLNKIIPGVATSSTLIYAPEVKFHANKPEVNKFFETPIEGIYVAGDGAGLSRGIVMAAATGIIAARGIIEKTGGPGGI